MKKEIWKDVPGYEGLYQVSNLGNVRSLNYRGRGKTRILSPGKDKKGYLHVSLFKDKNRTIVQIHRIVAITFIPNPNNLPVVNHKDWNLGNNCVDNLEWCTFVYNSQYRKKADILPGERKAVFDRYIKEHRIKQKVYNAEYYRKNSL